MTMLHDIRWTAEKIQQRLNLIQPLVYRRRQWLPPMRYFELDGPGSDPPVSPGVDDDTWFQIPWETYWGKPDTNFVLRTRFQVPASWSEDAPVALHLPIGQAGDFSHPEALAYVDGEALASCDRHHQEILLPRQWCDGELYTLALHGWTGGTQVLRFERTHDLPKELALQLWMRPCALAQIDQPTRELVTVARVALGVAKHLNENEPARANLFNALDESFKVLDTREPFGERFYASVPAALQVLRDGIMRCGAPLDVKITAIGHAHIDVAWLWTLDQTRRKVERTFHNVLNLMEQFPDFRFAQGQPQLYDFVREDCPWLFRAIQERVRTGQWEPVGGMWVEADCNLSGAESLVRQLLLGLRFFREHFGERGLNPVLWLPDAFGFAWNLPQLIREAELEYFFTIKIGWSQYNRFPYDSFWWQGLDGTRVLTHFSPTKASDSSFASTYNADASPQQVLSTWTNFQQKDWGKSGTLPPMLMSYGYGDGGGGPTREMVAGLGEMRAFPATPQVRFGTVHEFFQELDASVGERLPTWNGELYLEYHRGTYTTHARNKRANRKSEFLLHDAEFLASLASTLAKGYAYPHRDLLRAWELVCLNQFHDILPGSSIGQVYEDSLEQYAEVQALGERVTADALNVIGDKLGGDLLMVNPTSFARNEPALWMGGDLDFGILQRTDGSPVRIQPVNGGLLLDAGDLLPYSVLPLIHSGSSLAPNSEQQHSGLAATPDRLENELVRVRFNASGEITEYFDKRNQRQVLPEGTAANELQAFEDRPKTPDAWEIEVYYDDRMWLAEPAGSVEVVESGPLRATLVVRRRILSSDIVQRISLGHNSPRLDFETSIEWRERHILLKVAFPVDILSPLATYEIQWGNIQRPTHRNTSWDWARFETCAQKWVDLSEGGYGVSLLNDCKYGHDICGNVIRLTLLRGPTDPDPSADLGEHHFVYSLLPHAGGWDEFTVAQAYALNNPLRVWRNLKPATRHTPTTSDLRSFVSAAPSNVVIETIKKAEDGEGLIVRLYESQRKRCDFVLRTSFPLARAWHTNLLEENREPLQTEDHGLRGSIRPYQILTLRLLPGR